MIVQGLAGEKHVASHVESIELHGDRATALALVFSELLQNALEHGGDEVHVELVRRNGAVRLTVADNGTWEPGAREPASRSSARSSRTS